MRVVLTVWMVSTVVMVLPAVSDSPTAQTNDDTYEWRLPEGFPRPDVPASSPMSEAKVELGRHLFFDPRLSADGSVACATCHRPELAFTDGRSRPPGVTGELHPRSAMSLANVGYNTSYDWARPGLRTLEDQARGPMFGTHPVEMGLDEERLQELLTELTARNIYSRLFAAAFPDRSPAPVLAFEAIASFERTIVSGKSPFDRLLFGGDVQALSTQARWGLELFLSPRLGCSDCHRGFNFSGPIVFEGSPRPEPELHNTGLYNVGGSGCYPAGGEGLFLLTDEDEDQGRFRAPTLRNIGVTAPYMHDGSIESLEEVIDHYAAGGRTIAAGPRAGDGSSNPYKSSRMTGFEISDKEKANLVAFLESLTDQEFLTDPRFRDPWQ